MCVLAFAWRAHPRWRIVLAGNRDEFHARDAAPLARWNVPDHVIAGRDLRSGGTWLGVSDQGRLAVVTNLRGHGVADPTRASRGALVADLLAGAEPGPDAVAPDAYNPFNLIVADPARARFLSNRPETRRDLAPGLYGLSNATLDEPWPKTVRLKAALAAWLAGDASDPAALLVPLRDETRAGDDAMSPIFIREPVYGTRCSTVVALDATGAGLVVERRYAPDGGATGDTALRFSWPPSD
jgi:uncharacterized protein with NRDE domain